MPRKKIANINKFSLAEMTSNSDGKTSASGTMGVFIIFIGGIVFLIGSLGIIFKATDADILIQAVALVYAGALLLGYRKSADKDIASMPEYPESPIGPDITDMAESRPICPNCGTSIP